MRLDGINYKRGSAETHTKKSSRTAACGNPHGCTHLAYVKLISGLELPHGVVGLVFVMILSAMMSSLSSTLVSVTTVFTNDVWKSVRPKASEREVVHVGRIVVVLTVGVAMVTVPLVQTIDPNVSYRGLQMVQSYIAPSICAAVVMSICSARVTESATLIGLILGVVIAIFRCCLDVNYPSPLCGEDDERSHTSSFTFPV
jgi:Na+/proline symporter